jgi:4-hydroxy-3-polyprenylbenzoate decarboxylase
VFFRTQPGDGIPQPGSPPPTLPSPWQSRRPDDVLERFCTSLPADHPLREFPLLVLVDDARFTAESLRNFLWVVFTRSNPASDVDGVDAFTCDKHWGCRGPLVIDARIKPWHAPPLVEDPAVSRRVDDLAAPGGPLHGLW